MAVPKPMFPDQRRIRPPGIGHPDRCGRPHLGVAEAVHLADRRQQPHADGRALGRPEQVLADDHELVPGQPRQRVARTDHRTEPVGHPDQELIPDRMSVGVVHGLQPVEIDEEHRSGPVRPQAPSAGVVEPVEQQRPVRQSGQRVVQRLDLRLVPGLLDLLPGLRVDQVGRRDVGERLGGGHLLRRQCAGAVPVQVERPELPVAVAQWEGEHGHQAGRQRMGREGREAGLLPKVGDGHRITRGEGQQARAFAELGLQLLVAQGRFVRRGQVSRVGPGHDDGDAGPADREHVHDPSDEVIQDRLDGKVGGHGAGEVAEDVRQFLLDLHHRTPRAIRIGLMLAHLGHPATGGELDAEPDGG